MPCGCFGCRGEVVAIVDHPSGRRAVCDDHAGSHPVVEEVTPGV